MLEPEVHAAKIESIRLPVLRPSLLLTGYFMDGGEELRSPLVALHPHGPFKDGQAGDGVRRKLGELHVKVAEHPFEQRYGREAEARVKEGLETTVSWPRGAGTPPPFVGLE